MSAKALLSATPTAGTHRSSGIVRTCRRCGYYGGLKAKKRGELPHYRKKAMKLYGLLVVPGLIYELVTYNRLNYYCPDCRSRVC